MSDVSDRPRLSSLFGNFELVIAILLGIVSIATAYASFQAALYDSQMAGAYTKGGNLSTEAESLYLEGNQQYIQDSQLWNRMTELSIEMESSDPAIAADATYKFDTLNFMSVSEEFAAAIAWSDEQNQANPDFYTSPFESEEYLDYLFSGYATAQADSVAAIAEGDEANGLSDRLTLNTVLFSISLFLLGIAAIVRQQRTQILLVSVALVIFVIGVGLTSVIPFVGV